MRPTLALLLVMLVGHSVVAQETVRVTHRFDWRRSIDNQYQGLVYGYLTGSWKLQPQADGSTLVEARYYQASESRRNNVLLEKPIDAERVALFRLTAQGQMTGFSGDGVPYYRNFPAPLPAGVGPGSVWTGEGELVGDFLGTGITTRIPILIEYRWDAEGTYGSTPVVNVKTQYALRYQAGRDPQGDPTLSRADGTHIGVVSYDKATQKVLFLRETAKEQFTTKAGQRVANDGIVLTFYEGVPALGTSALTQTLAQAWKGGGKAPSPGPGITPATAPSTTPAAAPSDDLKSLQASAALARLPNDAPDVSVQEDPRGVKLTLENLQFVADQAVLLPGESKRLTTIASILQSVANRNILVVGHTAAVGSTESQDALSVQRALAIVEKLKAAGVPASRLLYEGRGGREPLADNATETGRAQNRRVEIIILDQ